MTIRWQIDTTFSTRTAYVGVPHVACIRKLERLGIGVLDGARQRSRDDQLERQPAGNLQRLVGHALVERPNVAGGVLERGLEGRRGEGASEKTVSCPQGFGVNGGPKADGHAKILTAAAQQRQTLAVAGHHVSICCLSPTWTE